MTNERRSAILSRVDHTCLKVDATWADIRSLCDDGMLYQTASVCIPPAYVRQAKAYVGDRLPICTVIGFPNGYSVPAVKVAEAAAAVADGADEIDMVIHVGLLKEGKTALLEEEIRAVKAACGEKILKVIVETCLLTDEEKATMCRVVAAAGADYIKTSTGFSHGGATPADIALFAANRAPGLLIKAAGGISSFEDAENMLALGADRLGTSRLVTLAKQQDERKEEEHEAVSNTAY
jgi:deoxyribose-phosphate aldolase